MSRFLAFPLALLLGACGADISSPSSSTGPSATNASQADQTAADQRAAAAWMGRHPQFNDPSQRRLLTARLQEILSANPNLPAETALDQAAAGMPAPVSAPYSDPYVGYPTPNEVPMDPQVSSLDARVAPRYDTTVPGYTVTDDNTRITHPFDSNTSAVVQRESNMDPMQNMEQTPHQVDPYRYGPVDQSANIATFDTNGNYLCGHRDANGNNSLFTANGQFVYGHTDPNGNTTYFGPNGVYGYGHSAGPVTPVGGPDDSGDGGNQ